MQADSFKGAWEVKPGDLLWEDAESQFLRSRKLGIYGATRAVKPRTLEEYRWDLKQLFDFMKERGVNHYAQLSEKLVLDYIEHLQSKGLEHCDSAKVPDFPACFSALGGA